MLTLEQYGSALRSHGLKATSQRLAVHEAMLKLVHGSADTVAGYINDTLGMPITSVSVYNTLALMTSLGIYSRRLSSDSKMYFDVDPGSHVHLYDTVNSEYRNLPEEKILAEVESHFKGRRFRGYSIDGIDIKVLCHPTRNYRNNKKQK